MCPRHRDSSYCRTLLGFQFQVLDTLLQGQWQVMDTPTISVTSYGHPLDSSVTSCGHPPRVSVPLIARILKKKLKMRLKMIFFTIFTMLIMFLRVFHVTYVKISLHVTVPLRLPGNLVYWFPMILPPCPTHPRPPKKVYFSASSNQISTVECS